MHSNDYQDALALIVAALRCDVAALDRLETLLDRAMIPGGNVPDAAAANIDKIIWELREERRPRNKPPRGWNDHVWKLWCEMCDQFERPYELGDETWGMAYVYAEEDLRRHALNTLTHSGLVKFAGKCNMYALTEKGFRAVKARPNELALTLW